VPTTWELVRTYGSPLYAYETTQVSSAVHDLRNALPRPCTLYYSVKVNPHPDIARVLQEEGCGAEVSSPGELLAARSAGFPAARLLYTGPAKTTADIDHAPRLDVRRFSVESLADLRRVGSVERGRPAVYAGRRHRPPGVSRRSGTW
jgi:diaminopimelate decarboxylase